MDRNLLFFGDNLHVLRKYVADASVDLIYLDPPFNSKSRFNILYKTPVGAREDARVDTFEDTWHWEEDAAADALDDHVGRQQFEEVDQRGDVLVAAHECDFAAGDLVG